MGNITRIFSSFSWNRIQLRDELTPIVRARKNYLMDYKGRYTRGSLLLQHAPATHSRSKAPSSAPTISGEIICCATKLLLQWQICYTSLFQEQAPWCVLKFACRDITCLQLANQIGLLFSSATHCEPQSGCFIIHLPRHVLRVHWLGYLPGSVFQEQAPSCLLAFRDGK